MRNSILTASAFLLGLASASLLSAQTLGIPWHAIGPAAVASGGTYSLSGSIAPGAGNMSGGSFSLSGGFWPVISTLGGLPTNGVGFCSNQITGTLRFNNSNPAILSLLNAPGNEGLATYFIYLNSVPPGRSGNSGTHPATGLTSSDYQLTVDADCTNAAGVSYVLTPYVYLGTGAQQYYYFNPKTSPPVVAGLPGPVVNFDECLGVIQLNFVDSQGAPLNVSGGYIYADAYNEIVWDIPEGATQQRLYVRGGDQPHSLAIALYRGTNVYTDRLTYYLNTNFTVACDAILDVNIVVPAAGALGQITGTMDMLREFEWTVPSAAFGYYPDLTGVSADSGPFANKRWTALYGDNATIPSSGTFQLINLVPSTDDPASPGYTVQGKMLIRTNRMVESFWTPALGSGSNPAVVVTPGATVNLGNMFQIDPGYLRGAIRLQGPAETSYLSILRGTRHCGDNDANHDGIPDQVGGNNGVYWSSIQYQGVDQRATGAQYTAAGATSWGDFDGDFDASSSSFLGHYELALGGLQGERSLWHRYYFSLWFSSPGWTGVGDDYDGYFELNDRLNREIEVVPGQPVTDDLAYGFSEVIVRIFSPSGDFTYPTVVFRGGLTGTNFLGQQADYYSDGYNAAYGTPYYQPTNQAQVRLLLPEGTYTLSPQVTVNGGNVGLAPINLTVGTGQRLDLGNCLRLDLAIPTHVSSNQLSLAGSVLTGCNNNVLDLTYELNGAAPVTVCNNCGANPTFNFSVPLLVGANQLTVTAHDDQGAVSSISGIIQFELPPFALRIISALRSGTDLQLEFTSQLGHTYNVLSSADLTSPAWTPVLTGIAGNGTIVQVTVPNAFTQPRQFFRIQQAQ